LITKNWSLDSFFLVVIWI